MAFLQLTLRFIIAVLACFVLASIFHSQFVLIELTRIDVQISANDWATMTLSDILGLLPGYGSVITVTLLTGFLLMHAIHKWLHPLPRWRYILAGSLAMATALFAMQPLLGVTLIAGARSEPGFLSQCLAGAVGGLVFTRMQHTAQRH